MPFPFQVLMLKVYFHRPSASMLVLASVSASMLKFGTWSYCSNADPDAKMGTEPNLASDADVLWK